MNKYFIKARWYRQCHAMPSRSQNLVIAEEPNVWLHRQMGRLGDDWTNIVIDNCCQISNDAEVSDDPDLGYKSPPLTPEQIKRGERVAIGFIVVSVFGIVSFMLYKLFTG